MNTFIEEPNLDYNSNNNDNGAMELNLMHQYSQTLYLS